MPIPSRLTLPLLSVAALALIGPAPAQAAPPPNDNFNNAVAVGAPPSQVAGSNIEATTQPNEPTAHGSQSVWWKWTADRAGRFRVDACDTLPTADLRLVVYTGSAVPSLTNVTAAGQRTEAPVGYDTGACADGALPAVVFDAAAGETYHFAVGAASCCAPTSSNIVLRLRKSAVNDNFAEATAIGAVPAQANGTNVFASLEQNEPAVHGRASVWWKWTADRSGRFRADACGTLPTADLLMAVYAGTAVGSLTNVTAAGQRTQAPLGYDTGACADGALPAVVFDAAAGQTYYFAVGASSCCTATSTNVVFRLRKSEVNDNFAEALTLTGAPHARGTGSNVFASLQQNEPTAHGGASIWWRWTAPQTGPYSVHTCNTLPAASTLVGIYTGPPSAALSAVPAQVEGCSPKQGSRARFNATAGRTYYFAVGAGSCCTVTSPGVVLTLRDTDCDQASRAFAKARDRARRAAKALRRAKARAARNPSASNTRRLANARAASRAANEKLRGARKVRSRRC